MSAGETLEHKRLKLLAAEWALQQGYRCVGAEIALANSGFRADVAAYLPDSELQTVEHEGRTFRKRQAALGSTAIFECKQARGDLFKDSCQAAEARLQLARLQSRREVIERLLRIHYPAAHLGDSLFREYDTFDFPALGHRGHAQTLQKIACLQNAILKKTKFEKIVRYRCANLCYLVTSENILANYEVPLSWGLLVAESGGLQLRQKPVWLPSSAGARLAILQKIAAAKSPRLLIDWQQRGHR